MDKHVDQMVMMRFGGLFVTRPSVAEIELVEQSRLFEQTHGAVYGRDRNLGIGQNGPAVQFLDIRMVVGIRQNARDNTALAGHFHAPFNAHLLQM